MTASQADRKESGNPAETRRSGGSLNIHKARREKSSKKFKIFTGPPRLRLRNDTFPDSYTAGKVKYREELSNLGFCDEAETPFRFVPRGLNNGTRAI
ncbi:MAG: hypothetical protein IK105_06240 [Thermoguttaceae bacterium]|nr:hypothetical protein [Thermoguttaceae bacterium]